MSAWNVECYLWGCKKKNRQVENYDFWGQMDIGPNPSSQMQCRASSLLSEPLLFFERGREMLTLQICRTAKLNEMFTALWKVFDAQKMLRPFWLRGGDLVLQLWKKVKVKCAQSCPDLCDLTGCSPPGSSVHGILQARVLECPSPGGLLNPGIEPGSPALQADSLQTGPPGKPSAAARREEISSLSPQCSST